MITDHEVLQKELSDAHKEALIPLNGDLGNESGPLFHYTNLDGCLGILENNTLRYTDIRYLNDPNELDDGLNIYNRVSESELPKYLEANPHFAYIMEYLRFILNLSMSFNIDNEIRDEYIEKLKSANLKYEDISYEKSPIYIACFSEKADDLRQWLPYSDNGKGAALGFKGVNKKHFFTNGQEYEVNIIRACYASTEKKQQYVSDIYKRAYDIFIKIDQSKNALYESFIESCFTGFLYDIIASKSENYRDEHEWRLIYYDKDGNTLQPKFRNKEGIIRPYIDIPFERDCLQKIILGPNSEKKLNGNALRTLSKKCGYQEIEFEESKISYRG